MGCNLKIVNAKKAILNPWIGCFTISSAILVPFFSIYGTIYRDESPLSRLQLVLICALTILITALILLAYNYIHIEKTTNALKVYIMISVEDWKNDKYISKDIKERMYSFFEKDGINGKVIVPNICYRHHFNKRIKHYEKMKKPYFEYLDWRLMQKYLLKGNLYIWGEVQERSANGSDKYIIEDLRMTVACSDGLSEESIHRLERSFGSICINNQIDKKYETEQFSNLSSFFVNLTEYAVGIAYLSGSYYHQAYILHSALRRKTTRGIPSLFRDLDLCLNEEISFLVVSEIRNGSYQKAEELLNSHIATFSENCSTTVLKAQLLVCISKDASECKKNAKAALALLKKQKGENDFEIGLLLLDQAYLHLLLEHYSEANKRYRSSSKYAHEGLYLSVLEYCDYVLSLDQKKFEHKPAEFVRAYALYRLRKYDDAFIAFQSVIEHCEPESYYYKESVKYLSTLPKFRDSSCRQSVCTSV